MRLKRQLARQLGQWREPHTMRHIVIGPTAEVEAKLGRSYHRGGVAGETCAVCLTCERCVSCVSQYGDPGYVLRDARAHADEVALDELRKLGARLLDGSRIVDRGPHPDLVA